MGNIPYWPSLTDIMGPYIYIYISILAVWSFLPNIGSFSTRMARWMPGQLISYGYDQAVVNRESTTRRRWEYLCLEKGVHNCLVHRTIEMDKHTHT